MSQDKGKTQERAAGWYWVREAIHAPFEPGYYDTASNWIVGGIQRRFPPPIIGQRIPSPDEPAAVAPPKLRIREHKLLSEVDLLSRLKRTRLRGFDRVEVYRDATLEVVEVDPATLTPAQRYVLQEGVQVILDVADAFTPLGIDVFSLRGALLFWPDGSDPDHDAPIPFLPPVIEESVEKDGTKVLLINDGIHRVYAARKRGRKINVVLARNVPAEYPYYAYALPQGWAQVDELQELQEGYQKKEYRNPENYKALFRDFNEIFPGVQKQRIVVAPPTRPAGLDRSNYIECDCLVCMNMPCTCNKSTRPEELRDVELLLKRSIGGQSVLPIALQYIVALEAQIAGLRADRERLTKADHESHDLCCRLAANIGVERSHSQQLREALERILKRVALVSPYYEMARAALEGIPPSALSDAAKGGTAE